jgi:hypothetical protein
LVTSNIPSGAQYLTPSSLDEEKSKHAGLAQQNGFGFAPALVLRTLLRLVKKRRTHLC